MRSNVRIDKEKAKSLMEMAKITLDRLNSFEKTKYPSNTLNDYYDVLHKLMEAYTSLKGLKFRGVNAHKELIDYICGVFFESQDRMFLQNLRQYRNQIAYEGFNVTEDYLKRNMVRIERYIKKLIKSLDSLFESDK